MIDALLHAALVGGGAYAGARLGEKYLKPAGETPIWTGHVGGDVGKPAVSITQVRYRVCQHCLQAGDVQSLCEREPPER